MSTEWGKVQTALLYAVKRGLVLPRFYVARIQSRSATPLIQQGQTGQLAVPSVPIKNGKPFMMELLNISSTRNNVVMNRYATDKGKMVNPFLKRITGGNRYLPGTERVHPRHRHTIRVFTHLHYQLVREMYVVSRRFTHVFQNIALFFLFTVAIPAHSGP